MNVYSTRLLNGNSTADGSAGLIAKGRTMQQDSEVERLNEVIEADGETPEGNQEHSPEDGDASGKQEPSGDADEKKPPEPGTDGEGEEHADSHADAPRAKEPEAGASKAPDRKPDAAKDGQNQQKKDGQKPQHTHEERERYAWEQLKRSNAEKQTRIDKLKKELEALKGSKSGQINREDYADEESYLEAKLEQKFAERDIKTKEDEIAENRKQIESNEIAEANERAMRNIEECYPTQEERKAYYDGIGEANKHHFSEVLSGTDAGKEILSYASRSRIGARLIYHFAMMPRDFASIIGDPNPQTRAAKLVYTEQYLGQVFGGAKNNAPKAPASAKPNSAPTQKLNAQKPQGGLPDMGKMGSGDSSDGVIDDETAINAVRNYS